MMLSHGVRSVLRTPFKTLLFLILIAAVTLLLCLGVGVWASSARMLAACQQSYRTIAVLEYRGPEYPDVDRISDADRAVITGTDLSALAADESVLYVQSEQSEQRYVSSYRQAKLTAPYGTDAVLVVSRCFYVAVHDAWQCSIVSAPYSYEDFSGNSIYLYVGNSDFTAELGQTFVVTGTFTDNQHFALASPSAEVALSAGISESLPPFTAVTDADEFLSGEGADYVRLAETLRMGNSSVNAIKMADPADHPMFHENLITPITGRLFTREETDAGAKVCMVSENISRVCQLTLGDELCLDPGTSAEERYEIVGICSFDHTSVTNVYLPGVPDASQSPAGNSYSIATFRLKNGCAAEFLQHATPLLSERMTLSVYDQGFSERAASLDSLQQISLLISLIALLAGVTVLLLFAHLFVTKQRETVETMLYVGTKKSAARAYLLSGAGLIAALSALGGALCSFFLSGSVMSFIVNKVSGTAYQDARFSSKACKVTVPPAPLARESLWLYLAVAAAVCACAVLLCLLASNAAFRPRKSGRQQQSKLPPPPKRSASLSGGFAKYALLSVVRGRGRSLLTPCACLVMALFVFSLVQSGLSYGKAEEALYDSSRISGQFVDIHGRQSNELVIRGDVYRACVDSPHIQDVALCINDPYLYYDSVQTDSSGAPINFTPLFIRNAFVLESTLARLSGAPKLIYTNAPERMQEFDGSDGFSVNWLDGWDSSIFDGAPCDVLPCVVTQRFLDRHGLSLGDTVRLYSGCYETYSRQTFIPIQPVIVGIFNPQSGLDNIYLPLPLDTVLQAPFSEMTHPKVYDEYDPDNLVQNVNIRCTADVAFLFSLIKASISAVSFRLDSARLLTEVKDGWEAEAIGYPGNVTRLRSFVILNDSEFLDSLDTLKRNGMYFEILSVILYVLVALVGVIASYLMVSSRRAEVAVMRSLGTSRTRIFLNLFIEQLLLCVLGSLAAAVLWQYYAGMCGAYWAILPLFAGSYLFGSALSLMLLNRRQVLALLGERE